jgi:hypothetical protein
MLVNIVTRPCSYPVLALPHFKIHHPQQKPVVIPGISMRGMRARQGVADGIEVSDQERHRKERRLNRIL